MKKGGYMNEKGKRSRLNLPRDEMAFRRIYRDLIEDETLTTIFRPEPRRCFDERGYCIGQIVQARVLETPGSDIHKIPPRFLAGLFKTIRIENIEVKPLGSLTKEDFCGSSPDVQDIKGLRYHLGLIYNLDPSKVTDETMVTKIKYSFINQELA